MRAHVFLLGLMLSTACGKVPAAMPDARACTTSAECTDPAAPYCVSSQCVAACSTNTDCSDPDHAICASDGACVGCTANTDCNTASAPICDTQARECRGCTKDSECAGGVCIEAEGTCTADADAVFVTMMGTDAGTCTRVAPCATVSYALGQIGTRRVIHVLGGTLQGGAITLTGNRVLDGEDTTLGTTGTAITINGPATVIVEGFRVAAPTTGNLPAINVAGSTAKATLYNLTVTGNGVPVITGTNGADVTLRRSHVGSLTSQSSNQVSCQNGKLLADQNTFENTYIMPISGECETIVTRNRFESSFDRSVGQTGGRLTMENNLIIHRDGYNDSISVGALNGGSMIRFNTVVNTTAVASDGAALGCDSSVIATSNIFAYNSGHPIVGQGCTTRYSVFDSESVTSNGTGNQVTGLETIFVNRAGGDYHLATGSVARAGAEPGLTTMVKTDYEGNPRPAPAGTAADCGAFEAQD